MLQPPTATIRTQVVVPLRFPDGFTTTARVFTFQGLVDGGEHVALGLGEHAEPLATEAVSARLRSHGCTANASPATSSAAAAATAARSCGRRSTRIAGSGGFLLYLRQEGRGIGLYAKLDAYVLQDDGLDTYEANLALGYGEDQRDYTVAAQMLLALGQPKVALLSNNPDKAMQLGRLGVTVSERVPTALHLSDANARYLATKVRRGAHTLDLGRVIAAERTGPGGAP